MSDAPDDIKPVYVVLPRQALFEFFGAVALPPWYEADGTEIGGTIDCAPIAQRVITWVDDHDLAGSCGPLEFPAPVWDEAERLNREQLAAHDWEDGE